MDIYMRKEDREHAHVYIAVRDETARAPFNISVRKGDSLYNLARALDECARQLQEKGLIGAEKRLFLQRDLMSKVHIAHLRHIEKVAYGLAI